LFPLDLNRVAREPPKPLKLCHGLAAHSRFFSDSQVREPQILRPALRKCAVRVHARPDSHNASAPFAVAKLGVRTPMVERLRGGEGTGLRDRQLEKTMIGLSVCHHSTMSKGCDIELTRPFSR
jgi:hypothetical protein